MVRLSGLSPSCTSRNRSRLLAFRNNKEESKGAISSEAVTVKEHWSTLGVEEKLAILRFQDDKLVTELYDIQQSLYASDLECLIHGFRGQDQVRHNAGIQFFDVEGVLDDNGNLVPKAWIAHRAFVEKEDMFDFLEERLGRPFLQGVPPVEKQQWSSILTPKPTSWLDFARVAFKLVEFALRKSQQEAAQALNVEPSTPVQVSKKSGQQEEAINAEASTPGTPTASLSQSAKRKARKKKSKAEQAAAAMEECGELEASGSSNEVLQTEDSTQPDESNFSATASQTLNTPGMAADDDEMPIDEEMPVLSVSQSLRQSAREARIASSNARPVSAMRIADTPRRCRINLDEESIEVPVSPDERSQTSSDSYDTEQEQEPVLAASQSLRQSASSARIGAVVTPALIAAQALRASAREAWVSAEIRMRTETERGRVRPPWLLADGSSGENWVDGFRAVIKNTFLDVEVAEPESSALRARSWPVYGGA